MRKRSKSAKMTDEQLVHYVEDRVEKARSEGAFIVGKKAAPAKPAVNIVEIIGEIGSVKRHWNHKACRYKGNSGKAPGSFKWLGHLQCRGGAKREKDVRGLIP